MSSWGARFQAGPVCPMGELGGFSAAWPADWSRAQTPKLNENHYRTAAVSPLLTSAAVNLKGGERAFKCLQRTTKAASTESMFENVETDNA